MIFSASLRTAKSASATGEAVRPGLVYDSNGRILADAVRERRESAAASRAMV